jgi:lysozyme
MVPGIDVSHHQGVVDWPSIAASGIRFGYVKATEGQSFVDSAFTDNWSRARDAGLVRGAYHFFRPAATVANQVENFIRTLPRLEPGDLPPALDLEEARTAGGVDEWDDVPRGQRVARAVGWLQAVEDALGMRPVVYTRAGFVDAKLPSADSLGVYPLWIAQYTQASAPRIPPVWTAWTIWQHTDRGNVVGVRGTVDLDRFNGSETDLLAFTVPEG